jgi:hypothetical protein
VKLRKFAVLAILVPLSIAIYHTERISAQTSPPLGWSQIPNSTIDNVCAGTHGFSQVLGQEGCKAIESWSGGAFDSTRNRLIVWGGGHDAYYGNELYAVDLDTLTTTRLNDPGLPLALNTCCTANGTQAASRHTYDGIEYMPNIDRMFVFGGSPASSQGLLTNDTWTFNFANMTWQKMNPSGPIPDVNPGVVAAYDPNTGKIFLHDNLNLFSYDFFTNSYKQLSNNGSGIDYHLTGVIDPVRKKFVAIGNGQQWIYDISTNSSYTKQALNAAGGSALVNTLSPGLDYDPVSGKIVGWSGGNNVYLLDLGTNTWTVVSNFTNGPGALTYGGTGTFGRWRYSPTSNLFVVVNGISKNAYTFRLDSALPPAETTPPTVTISAPAGGSTVSATTTVSANAADNIGVVGVQFKLDGVNLGAEDTTSPYSISWNTVSAANGSHLLTAVARDAAGNSTTSGGVSVTVSNSAPPTDTIPPTVSMTAPTNGSTVSGSSVTVSANASDNVGVVGIQFKLDGSNLGSEDTSSPYAITWNTTTASNGTHSLSAVARDAGGNQTTTSAVSVTVDNTVPPPSTSSDFTTRCQAAGVVKCVGFDQASEIAGTYGNNSGILSGATTPTLDSSVKASGNSAIKFTVPSNAAADTSGSYFTNFSSDLATQFGANEEFYIQWRQRFTPEFISSNAGSGWKQTIIGTGDKSASQLSTSCTDLEVVTVNGSNRRYSQMYNSCSGSTSHDAYDPFYQPYGGSDFKMQNARPSPYCLYSQTNAGTQFPPTGNCFGYFANEWMTFQVGVTLGPRVGDEFTNSRVRLWVAREGQPSELVIDWGPYNLSAGPATENQKFGKVWLLPYNTGRSPSTTYAASATWYDELIISRNRIADSGMTTPSPTDTTPPAVAITAPANGNTVSGSNLAVSANASDNVGVVGVQFKLDGVNLGAEDTTSPYSINWNTTSVANGNHLLTAVARDAAGNQTTSVAVSLMVNNGPADVTPPSVSLTAPAAGATLSGSVTVSATASDNVGVVGVQFQVDGANLGLEDTTSPYTVSWNTALIANGTHTLTAVARDVAGNQTTSAGILVTVNNTIPDTIAPTVSVITPASGDSVFGSNVMVSASASDNVGVAGVQFQLDATPLGTEDTAPPYSIFWNTTQTSNGSHTVRAVVRDAAGNKTTSSGITITVNNDSMPPLITITSPVSGSTVSGSSVTVSASASDNLGITGVQFKLDGVDIGSEITASPYVFIWNTTQATSGAHALSAVARDAAGNQTTSGAINVTVSNGADAVPPTVSITAPQAGMSLSAFVTVSASASDNTGVVGVQFAVDGINIGAEDTTAPYAIVWDTTKAINGSHQVRAIARDGAGNLSSPSEISVSVDNIKSAGLKFTVPRRGGGSWKWQTSPPTSPSSFEAVNTEDPLTIGYLRIQADSGAAAPTGAAIIGFRSNGVLVSEAGVPATAPVLSGMIPAEVTGPVNTGLAIANPGNQEAQISFFFRNANGAVVSAGSFSLGSNQQMSAFLNQQPFLGPDSFQGTFAFMATTPVSVTALRGFVNERNEFLVTTLPIAPFGSGYFGGSMVLPLFADGGGWSTQVILENPGTIPLNGTVQFFSPGSSGSSGTPQNMKVNGDFGSSFNYSIPPFGSLRLITGNASSSVSVGSVRISATAQAAVPRALAIFSYKALGTTLSEASVPLSEPGLAFQTYVESSAIEHIESGVAISNLSLNPVTVNLELFTLAGDSTGLFGSVQIPGSGQLSKFLDEIFPSLPAGFLGVLRLTAPSQVTVIGLRGRYNERNDFLVTTIPVSNDAAALATPFETIFPHIVNGGGYNTQFVLLGSGPDGSASGTLQLVGKDGAPLNLLVQ